MQTTQDRIPIKAYALPGAPQDLQGLIRPCKSPRQWMDHSPERYAYRCIPLTAANTMGWELLNGVDCEMVWNGLSAAAGVTIYRHQQQGLGPRSHFGMGTVTWDIPFLFRTPPDYGLVVTGPGNHDRAHIAPLDGFVRTDWVPFPFTMNWRITTANQAVRFAAGEPICRIYPYPLALLEHSEIEVHELDRDPELKAEFQAWLSQRQQAYQRRNQAVGNQPHNPKAQRENWIQRYAHGVGADGKHEHQNVFRCAPVADCRALTGNGDSP